LIAVGLEGYTNQLGVFQVEKLHSWTALIPSAIGALLASCGLIAIRPSLRKHVMHLAAVVGLLGAVAGLWRGLAGLPDLLKGTAERPAAVKQQLTMGIICLVFLILCVRSFILARRRRKAQA